MSKIKRAYLIYKILKGEPKSHEEWCSRFNIVYLISKYL